MFKLHNTRSRHEGDLAPKRSPSRARLLGAGLAITVAAIAGGAYTSTAAYAGGSGHPYTSDYRPYGGNGGYGDSGGWGSGGWGSGGWGDGAYGANGEWGATYGYGVGKTPPAPANPL